MLKLANLWQCKPLLVASIALVLAASATSPVRASDTNEAPAPAASDRDPAIYALQRLDLGYLDDAPVHTPLAAALAALAQRKGDAGRQLADAIGQDLPDEIRSALIALALNHYRHQLDFSGFVAVAVQLEQTSDPDAEFWADAIAPTADIPASVIELDYSDRKITGTIGGEPVTIIFDTGAPGISIDYDIVTREGYPVFTGGNSYSVVPQLGTRTKKDATIIEAIELGGAVLRNIPASTGRPGDAEDMAPAPAGLKSEMIFGLDMFARFFAAIELDQVEGKLRLYRDAAPSPTPGRFLMGVARYPLVRTEVGTTARTVIIDTGSANNNLPPEWLENVPCGPVRTYQRSWGSFSERLVPVTINFQTSDLWVTPRAFGQDAFFQTNGVLGAINRGRMIFDLKNGGFAMLDYDPARAGYAYEPESISSTCDQVDNP